MKRLVKDESLCVGCHNCEEACAMAFTKTADTSKACLRIDGMAKTNDVQMRVCTQCGICASVCNTGVIQQNKFGVYMINKKECVGCYMCVGFCPEQVMYYVDGRNDPGKCTACGICVKACPVGALSIQDV